MLKRLPYLALALAFASSLRAGRLGAIVVSWDIDSTKNMVTLHLANNTAKDITFLNISIKETYANGSVNEHQFSQEMPDRTSEMNDPTFIHGRDLREYYHGGDGTWQAGTPREVKIAVQPGLTRFEAVLDALTYSDATAETTNPDALARELDATKAAVATLRATNDVIRRALANTADKSPHETAAKEIEGLQKKWEEGGHQGSFNPGASGRIISDLRDAPADAAHLKQSLRDYLAGMLARNEKLAAMYLEQSEPKVGGVESKTERDRKQAVPLAGVRHFGRHR